MLTIFLVLISLPAIFIDSYYFHVFDNSVLYIQFRSINNFEILNCLIWFSIWYLAWVTIKENKILRYLIYIIFIWILLIIPYVKPIIMPIETSKNDWLNNVCIQSTPSTCWPCALATIFKYYWINSSEWEIAKNTFSSKTSTEIWYLIRYINNNWLKAKIIQESNINKIPYPSILWTTLNTWEWHFITLLWKKNQKIIIWDSLIWRRELSLDEFNAEYKLSSYSIFVSKN